MKIRLEAISELSDIFGGRSDQIIEVDVSEGITVLALFDILAARYQKFKELVFNPDARRLTGNATVVLNGYLINPDDGLETPLQEYDIITFVPIIGDG